MKKINRFVLILSILTLSLAVFLVVQNRSLAATQAGTTKSAVPTKVTPEQQGFINTHPNLNVVWNTSENVPYSLRGFNTPVTGDTAVAALNFLEEIKSVFKMKNAASEMSLRMVQNDNLNFQHARFYQKYNGLRVIGGELIVHVNNKKTDLSGQRAVLSGNSNLHIGRNQCRYSAFRRVQRAAREDRLQGRKSSGTCHLSFRYQAICSCLPLYNFL
jgi:Zn-dependent metalloprotease